jgi:ABC-type bacteriocin/lantibiotic exporter with double-glycine peptidase domain
MEKQYIPARCAQHAMQAAFVMLGQPYSLSLMHKVTKSFITTLVDGVDVPYVENGIQQLGYEHTIHEYIYHNEARIAMIQELEKGNPCITAVKNSKHWVVVIGLVDDKFVVFDSYGKTMIDLWEWSDLHRWMVTIPDEDSYFFIAVKQKGVSIVTKMKYIYSFIKERQHSWRQDLIRMYKRSNDPLSKWMSELYYPRKDTIL